MLLFSVHKNRYISGVCKFRTLQKSDFKSKFNPKFSRSSIHIRSIYCAEKSYFSIPNKIVNNTFKKNVFQSIPILILPNFTNRILLLPIQPSKEIRPRPPHQPFQTKIKIRIPRHRQTTHPPPLQKHLV